MAKTGGNKKATKKNNNKKKLKRNGPKAVAMKQNAAPKDNPFETIWSRRKFDILGQKRKGEQRRVGLSRSLAIEKRTETLLKDYEQSKKSSVLLDKRIGEKNYKLGEYDKGLLRSQREHQLKFSRKSKHNLSDGEEDDFEALGLGRVPQHDDFDDEMLSDDDKEDAYAVKSDTLKKLAIHDKSTSREHSVVGHENRRKTKKEVMEEVIHKSKLFKAEKAKDKEENEKLLDELEELGQSQVFSSLTSSGKANPLRDGSLATRQEQPDSYDKLVNEMVLEMRARPSDRTKTPEEIAQEERDRLEKLEEERKKRMNAVNDSDEDDDAEKPSTQRLKSVSGDDLGDSFSIEEEPITKKGWVDEILERKDTYDSEDEGDDSSEDSEGAEDDVDESSDGDRSHEKNDGGDKNLSLKDWEQSDDNDDDVIGNDEDDEDKLNGSLDGDEEEIKQRGEYGSKKQDESGKGTKGSSDMIEMKTKGVQRSLLDVPFLIDAPESFKELCGLLESRPNGDVIVIINRIRGSNGIKAARKKLQVFYGVLLQYFAVLANKTPLNFELLNLLVKPLVEISMEIPYFAAICARQRILQTRMQFCEAIKDPANGCWPSLKTLSLLRLWSMIFPCSDFRHAVMTPVMLLMCEYLMRCPILSGRDIAIGSFLCTMVYSISKQSQKFFPEAIVFLRSILMTATGKKPSSDQELQFDHFMELKAPRPLLCMHDHVNEISPLNLLSVIEMPDESSFFSSDSFRASVLAATIETLGGFVEIYKEMSPFPEIFLPISTLLLDVSQQQKMLLPLQHRFREIAELIKKISDECHILRRPLQMRKQKPVPIKLLNPKFEENFVKGRDYDPDRQRVEMRKLKKQLKEEAKGAARELRKDNKFLMEVKQKEKAMLDEERAEMYGKAKAFLQEQEHAFKSGQLGKGRKRRR